MRERSLATASSTACWAKLSCRASTRLGPVVIARPTCVGRTTGAARSRSDAVTSEATCHKAATAPPFPPGQHAAGRLRPESAPAPPYAARRSASRAWRCARSRSRRALPRPQSPRRRRPAARRLSSQTRNQTRLLLRVALFDTGHRGDRHHLVVRREPHDDDTLGLATDLRDGTDRSPQNHPAGADDDDLFLRVAN